MADSKPRARKKWIKGAIEHPGALKAKAEAAGETTREFAAKNAGDSGTTGKQARLAETLMGMSHGGKRRLRDIYRKKD